MPVRTGDPAPAFSLPAKPGETVDLADHIGRDRVVLLFFPLAFSPVCTDEMCHLRDDWDRWAGLEATVFGVSVDSPFVTDRFREELGVPFPILSDFNRDVARQYDVLHAELVGLRDVAKRSAFVVGRDGRVAWSWVTDDPRVQVPFDELEAAVAGA
ncbi:MAG: redoxin domain-containing protein [Planctomycetota bacterium]|jgi:peroxiredoxin